MPIRRHSALLGPWLPLAGLIAACSSAPKSVPGAAGSGGSGAGSPSGSGGVGGAVGSGGSNLGGSAGTGSGTTGGNGGSSASGGTAGAGGGVEAVECQPASEAPVSIAWDDVNAQPAAFYSTPEALWLAENVIYYQNADGGWPKNLDMTTRSAPKAETTIDNGATTTQIEFLARVHSATGCIHYRDAALAGVALLLEAQYDNGGWPQEYPNPMDYHTHITFNDNAMIHVLQVLRAISQRVAPYTFVDDALSATTATAVSKGIDCILACQIELDAGQRGWCAQHDEVTLEPAQARTYELPSVSGSEGAQIARFLMTIDPPTPAIRAAVEGAIAWFEAVKITGIRIEATVDANQPTGEDRVVVEDPTAPPIWARFYELYTNVPIFSSRCEVPECDEDPFYMRRYSLAEIENERRVGYAWYGNWPAQAITEYAAWKAKYPAP